MNTIARQAALPFTDPNRTLDGSPRARVRLEQLEMLWFNTGTRCNLTCQNCYIESSPSNDRLAFLQIADVLPFLDEIASELLRVRTLGYTGGEPFLNPAFMDMLTLGLDRGMEALVLTNAMRPMQQAGSALLELRARVGDRLMIRVSVDHFDPTRHREERGAQSWAPMLRGLRWLSEHGFALSVAGRTLWGDTEADLRAGYADLFRREGIGIDAQDPAGLILFPEMDPAAKVPEVTTACWGTLGKNPADMMCASSRMVVRRQGAARAAVLACTLLPYDARFEMGATLVDASNEVALNHVHCARFCVLGGGSCTG